MTRFPYQNPLSLNRKRGEPRTIRLLKSSYDKFDEIFRHRKSLGIDALKADIWSEAVDMLYEKEFNKGETK